MNLFTKWTPSSGESDAEDTTGVLGGAPESKSSANADLSAANRGTLQEEDEVKFNVRVPENLRDAFQNVCEEEGRSVLGCSPVGAASR
ncbi:hypothetical protein GGQ08_003232 [Salinibacter ruber]|jgi:hypothetical protein|nr:Arc family DNA-binding protein [Salinibacter ruber]MCS3655141.1 hypothetical protein [Salinibacter ruber]